jgi:hypothetical protein
LKNLWTRYIFSSFSYKFELKIKRFSYYFKISYYLLVSIKDEEEGAFLYEIMLKPRMYFHQPPMLGYIPNKCPDPVAGGRIKPI